MSDYASTDTELVDSGHKKRGRGLQKPTSKGKAYNEQRKHRTCINFQTKITKHVNKINLATRSHDDCHIVKQELDILITLKAELKEAFQLWRTELTTEQELTNALAWYDEQCERNSRFRAGIEQWITSAKQSIEEQIDKRSFYSHHSSRAKSSSFSKSSSQARVKERLKVVELRAKAPTLERKQKLENEAEKLRLEEEIAIAEGREETLLKIEQESNLKDGMNQYYKQFMKSKATPYDVMSVPSASKISSTSLPTYTPSTSLPTYTPSTSLPTCTPSTSLPTYTPCTLYLLNMRITLFRPSRLHIKHHFISWSRLHSSITVSIKFTNHSCMSCL